MFIYQRSAAATRASGYDPCDQILIVRAARVPADAGVSSPTTAQTAADRPAHGHPTTVPDRRRRDRPATPRRGVRHRRLADALPRLPRTTVDSRLQPGPRRSAGSRRSGVPGARTTARPWDRVGSLSHPAEADAGHGLVVGDLVTVVLDAVRVVGVLVGVDGLDHLLGPIAVQASANASQDQSP